MKQNNKVKMLTNSDWWDKGDIGRIVRICDDDYLICFDHNCTREHDYAGDHAWWAGEKHFERYRLNRLMKVE